MNESLVQWTLLNNVDYLSEALNFEIASKRGQEITTDYGSTPLGIEINNIFSLDLQIKKYRLNLNFKYLE
ncbi:MAG: hypothetical protein U9O85_01160 [Euryarchaeota archaeon]|nr:hypothetical protein [Euryarchaeota archaeon]